LQFTNFDLNAVVAGLSTMWRRILGEDITVRVQASRIAPVIHGDPGMMEQVLMNLVVNAREAMTHGGRLDIITTVEPNDDVAVPDDARASASGRFVHLRVSDTGTGIAPEHLSRIFEPFFTTKEVHRGSGLGLATAYGIVRQHHGWITVRSEQGHGTTFDIYLPATDEPASRTVTSKRDEARVGGRETLLLIEDETAVRQLARTVLERHGYRTLDAIDGVNALEIWREHGHEIDVILTDMVLPEGISGIDVATRIRAERPDIPVIVTSGYSVEMAGKELLPDERITFLQKPYRPQQLLRVVRDTLDAVHSARRG
jgi:CheY-like chemotaxis protein